MTAVGHRTLSSQRGDWDIANIWVNIETHLKGIK